MTTEQFTQIVDAILEGKYSWACVLILRFAGYNPLHYIPYRTYNRLMKENAPCRSKQRSQSEESATTSAEQPMSQHPSNVKDLTYLEVLDPKTHCIRGGDRFSWFN